jgi:hypothetical protein
MVPVNKMLLNQGFLVIKLKYSLRTFYCRHHDLVNRYGIFITFSRNLCHGCSLIYSDCCSHNPVLLSSFITYLLISTRIRRCRPLVSSFITYLLISTRIRRCRPLVSSFITYLLISTRIRRCRPLVSSFITYLLISTRIRRWRPLVE